MLYSLTQQHICVADRNDLRLLFDNYLTALELDLLTSLPSLETLFGFDLLFSCEL
jgi:hypothetical protein